MAILVEVTYSYFSDYVKFCSWPIRMCLFCFCGFICVKIIVHGGEMVRMSEEHGWVFDVMEKCVQGIGEGLFS